MSLPAADELFRTTGGAAVQPSAPQQEPSAQVGQANGEPPSAQPPAGPAGAASPGPKVPAPASEPDPETDAAEPAAGDLGSYAGNEAANGGRRTARGARGGAKTDEPRTTAPPQQAVPAPAERTGRRGSTAKGRQATGSSAPSPSPTSAASSTSSAAPAASRRGRAARRPSGRERHDEKITVYVSAEELMDLEHARLVLRGEHGLAVDRGRIVREAVAVVLADLESRGDASILVRRLRGR
ncbi:hypothetical protein ACQEU8_25285 [Streptomyces sp. CA-250714]|uniref:hypothetical protein n=1 Tax=Streptomyces sp. CA-250714 TaxID=3240060 RepID=UPI003D911867